jgi:glycosyltransferase involved in cell wall biosynthesis
LLRLLFVADGRSPITENWLRYVVDQGHSVHLVSTYPCTIGLELASLHTLPVAFGDLAGGHGQSSVSVSSRSGTARSLARNALPPALRTRLRQWFGPLSLSRAVPALREIFQSIQPDLVHAMRIPYEGMLASLAGLPAPLVLSIWGNDFTLHAGSTPLTRRYTRLALQSASGLHVDCQRDLRLAYEWGFPKTCPSIVLPTSGGIQTDLFYPATFEPGPQVINPRGFRAYVNNAAFFRSIPLVLARHPEAMFVFPAMQSESRARDLVSSLKIQSSTLLLPRQSRVEMADLFRSSQVVVSPTTHDGTPNTLLEAMACGCFPVAGDLESLREWLLPGVNGLLVDPGDPHALANAVCHALENEGLRRRAAEYNQRLVSERAGYSRVMEEAIQFYGTILNLS